MQDGTQQGLDPWLQEFEEAMRLTNEIASRLEEMDELARAGSDASRTISSARRRLKRLYAIADKLDAALENGPENQEVSEKELYRRKDMVMGIRYRAKSQATMLPQSSSAAGSASPSTPTPTKPSRWEKPAEAASESVKSVQENKPEGEDAHKKVESEDVNKPNHTVVSVHDGPVNLHARLLESIDNDRDESTQLLKVLKANISWLGQQTSRHCSSCMCLLLSLLAAVIVVLVGLDLIKEYD
jgi:hypothetical protein